MVDRTSMPALRPYEEGPESAAACWKFPGEAGSLAVPRELRSLDGMPTRTDLASLLLPLSLFTVGCSSDGGPAGSGGSGSGSDGGSSVPPRTLQVDLGLPSVTLSTRAAPTSDGFVIASFNNGLQVARLDRDLEPAWAVDIQGPTVPQAIAVDSQDRTLILAGEGGGIVTLVRLTVDGELDAAVQTTEGSMIADFVLLDDDGLLLGDSTRLSEDLTVVNRGNTRGERVAKSSDGFVFLSALDLGLGGRMSGVTLRKTDADGMLEWQTFASPGAANYTSVGLRELPNGSLLGAVAGDTNPGHTLFVAVFDADGTFDVASDPEFTIDDSDGYEAPLQFGGGIDLVEAGSRTFVSFIANSGALGSNVQTQLAAELSAQGDVLGVMTKAGGIAYLDGALALYNGAGGVTLTTRLTQDCAPSPNIAPDSPTPETEFKTLAELQPVVPTVEFTPFTPTLTARTLTPSQLCE